MYLNILKKDLKRKKTMNIILLLFIILAATFISSSVNNMISVITALDSYFEKANVPDYTLSINDKSELERYEDFADENSYEYKCSELTWINPKLVKIDGEEFDYSNTLCLSSIKDTNNIFDSNNEQITKINDGEIYVTSQIFHNDKYNFKVGSKIKIEANGKEKTFTLKGYIKDAMFGSEMIGMTRFLISEDDCELFKNYEGGSTIYSVNTYTDDVDYSDKLSELNLKLIFNVDKSRYKLMYFMDMLIAAIMLIVSICLILISMVMLNFTIKFTVSEEYREIGVMKAIGVTSKKIRGLYILKYFAISLVGAVIGFFIGIPFGKMMMENVSKNIMISESDNLLINMICSVATAGVVVLFCYVCTGKIKKFSPIDAIRNGNKGERYAKKGIISLNKSKIRPIWFMSLNDILSGLKRYIAMILVFILGLLLILFPINAINTLQSDDIITWFNMAKCDHVVLVEQLFNTNSNNKKSIEEKLDNLRDFFEDNEINADVYQEIMFRMNISHNDKKMSSLAFQGVGDVTTEQYVYLEGTAPQNNNEVAITALVADSIGAEIGDDVEINDGETTKTYTVTAIFQSMNNLGEGIRFYNEEVLDYRFASGCFGMQIKYNDDPDEKTITERKNLLKEEYVSGEVYDSGEYINYAIGDIAGQLKSLKYIIIAVVLCINILVTVLMVKSFVTREKGEIAMLKAIGFKNISLVAWQTIRIGIVLFISILIATLISTPVSEIMLTPIFQMMGAQSIKCAINPIEVYLIYPILVFVVTLISAMLSALNVRKVSTTETFNIE